MQNFLDLSLNAEDSDTTIVPRKFDILGNIEDLCLNLETELLRIAETGDEVTESLINWKGQLIPVGKLIGESRFFLKLLEKSEVDIGLVKLRLETLKSTFYRVKETQVAIEDLVFHIQKQNEDEESGYEMNLFFNTIEKILNIPDLNIITANNNVNLRSQFIETFLKRLNTEAPHEFGNSWEHFLGEELIRGMKDMRHIAGSMNNIGFTGMQARKERIEQITNLIHFFELSNGQHYFGLLKKTDSVGRAIRRLQEISRGKINRINKSGDNYESLVTWQKVQSELEDFEFDNVDMYYRIEVNVRPDTTPDYISMMDSRLKGYESVPVGKLSHKQANKLCDLVYYAVESINSNIEDMIGGISDLEPEVIDLHIEKLSKRVTIMKDIFSTAIHLNQRELNRLKKVSENVNKERIRKIQENLITFRIRSLAIENAYRYLIENSGLY